MLPLQTVVALGLYLSGAPLQHSSSSAASRAAVVRAQASSAPVVGLDVVELTKDFLKSASGYYSPVDASKLDEAFVFRAPTIGPLNKKDYVQTMTKLQTYVGFPDLTPNAFGFTVDPDDERKCIFWTRATGTFSQPWNPYGAKLEALRMPPTGATARLPTECYSITIIHTRGQGQVSDRRLRGKQPGGQHGGLWRCVCALCGRGENRDGQVGAQRKRALRGQLARKQCGQQRGKDAV